MTHYKLDPAALQFSAIRASGPGGQHVNKVATAMELRLVIAESGLPEAVQQRLLACRDRRITQEGEIVIKAQRFRSQDKNRQDALQRLEALIDKVAVPEKKRIATKPGRAAREKRLQDKKKTSDKKSARSAVKPSLE